MLHDNHELIVLCVNENVFVDPVIAALAHVIKRDAPISITSSSLFFMLYSRAIFALYTAASKTYKEQMHDLAQLNLQTRHRGIDAPYGSTQNIDQKALPLTETIIVGLISAASGLFGVIVGTVLPWFRDRWNDKRQARYLAIRVVCVLG